VKVLNIEDLQILWANRGRSLTEVLEMQSGWRTGLERNTMVRGRPVEDFIGVRRKLGSALLISA